MGVIHGFITSFVLQVFGLDLYIGPGCGSDLYFWIFFIVEFFLADPTLRCRPEILLIFLLTYVRASAL